MPTNPKYTFSLYAGGRLLTNCYREWSGAPLDGAVLNGVAPTRADAVQRIAALRKRVTVADSVMVWYRGRAVRL